MYVSHFVEHQIMGPTFPKEHDWQKIWKDKHQNRSKHIAIYFCTNCQSNLRTLDFGTNSAKKCEWKEFWKNKH